MLEFEELSHNACRWPIADCGIGGEKGQFLFCGDAIAERYIAPGVPCPYCATHAGMAYEPSRPSGRTIAKNRGGRRATAEADIDRGGCLRRLIAAPFFHPSPRRPATTSMDAAAFA
jgi:hypothetical protein